jgi:uncharacterized membrane protein
MLTVLGLAFFIGIVAGLRAMMAPALVSWAAHLGWLGPLVGWPSFMAWRFTPWIFSLLSLGELVTDQLPSTPSRKVPAQFGGRLLSGGLSGATLGAAGGAWLSGLIAGVIGAALGTFGGAAARGKLAASFGMDRPAALIEDAVAILLGSGVILVAMRTF